MKYKSLEKCLANNSFDITHFALIIFFNSALSSILVAITVLDLKNFSKSENSVSEVFGASLAKEFKITLSNSFDIELTFCVRIEIVKAVMLWVL